MSEHYLVNVSVRTRKPMTREEVEAGVRGVLQLTHHCPQSQHLVFETPLVTSAVKDKTRHE